MSIANDTLIRQVRALIPINYSVTPSSSSGKYHAKGETLGAHTELVIKRVVELTKMVNVRPIDIEELLVAAELHDMCKYSDKPDQDNLAIYKNGGHTRRDHAERAYRALAPIWMNVAKMVRIHMQCWSEVPECHAIWLKLMDGKCDDRAYQLGMILAYADYDMSRADKTKPYDEKSKNHLGAMQRVITGYFGRVK